MKDDLSIIKLLERDFGKIELVNKINYLSFIMQSILDRNTAKKVLLKKSDREVPWEYVSNKSVKGTYRTIGELGKIKFAALVEKDNVLGLVLSTNLVKLFPEFLLDLKNLKYLCFLNSSLGTIPIEIKKLSSLEEIYINNSKVTHLPDEIRQLKKLKILCLNNNLLSSLSRQIVEIPELKRLELEGNPLQFPPLEIANSKNKIETIRNYFSELDKRRFHGRVRKHF